MTFGNATSRRLAAREATYTNKRHVGREAVYKGAQIILAGKVAFDCVVMNISTKGARVRTGEVVPVPEQVTLQLRGGTVIPARRCWTQGTSIGLEFAGAAACGEEGSVRARAALELLRTVGLQPLLKNLRAERFFDDVELAVAAEEAKVAHSRLESVLKSRATARPA